MTIFGPDGKTPLALNEIPSALALLRKATSDAIERMRAGGTRDGAGWEMNWVRVGCYSAEHFETDEGQGGFRVWIEDAAPEAVELRNFIRADLAEHGWPGVEVRTEW